MKKPELEKLTTEQLKQKEKGSKTMIGIFIPIILLLLFFAFRDYFRGEELDMTTITIILCSIGGMVSIFPEVKVIREILKERE